MLLLQNIIATDGTASPVIISHFKFGSYDIASLGSGAGPTAYANVTGGLTVPGTTANDTFITGTGATSTATAGTSPDAGSTLAIIAGSPSISGVASNATTITKDSKVYLGN
jgi:hypothetical protein